MSPAWSFSTSMRSFPCATAMWPSFSTPLRVALKTSAPFATVPLRMRKKETSPTCGSLCVLKTHAAKGVLVLRVDLDRPVALGALERVQLLHLEGARHELDDLREEGARAVGLLGADAEEREELALLHPLLHRGDRLVAADLLALRDSARASRRRCSRSSRSAPGSTCRRGASGRRGRPPPRTRRSSCPSCRGAPSWRRG